MAEPIPSSRRRWAWADLVLATTGAACTALLAAAVPGSPVEGPIGWGYVVLNAALCVCLAVRSRWRRATFVAVYCLLALLALLVHLAPVNMGVTPLIVAAPLVLYQVARHEPPAWGTAALLLGLVGTLASPTRRMPGGGGVMVPLAILVMVATYLWATSLRRSDEEHARQLHQAQVVAQAEAAQRVALAEATERARIASEVHDIVGHSLTVVIVQANTALALQDPALARQTLQQVRDGARQALAELRGLVSELRTNDSTHVTGTLTDLETMVRGAREAGLELVATLPGQDELDRAQQEWPSAARLAVVRIVQESLTNALKHAATPANAVLEVVVEPGLCRIVMANDAPAGAGALEPGNGLLGLQERARRAGGSYRAECADARVCIRATIPTTHPAGERP